MELSGKTALLTGATGGLGREIAASLAERGATLVLSSRKPEQLAELAASLPGSGHRTAVADLAEPGAAAGLAAEAGEVDVLVANAGLPASGRIGDFSEREIERAVRVNLEAPIVLARALLERMRERGAGHLVLISSLAGKVASPRGSLYSATKFGLRGFALGMQADLDGTGVGVSVVMPGFIREAGMFADSGAKPPPGLGTASPPEVGEGVVSAIERDRLEVEVAPPVLRLVTGFAHRHPSLASRIQRGNAGSQVADRVAEGQADKR